MIDRSTIVLLSRSSTGLSLYALLSSPLRFLHLPESTTGHPLLLVQSMGELLGGLLNGGTTLPGFSALHLCLPS